MPLKIHNTLSGQKEEFAPLLYGNPNAKPLLANALGLLLFGAALLALDRRDKILFLQVKVSTRSIRHY
jgi:hypothetical protein